MLGKLFRPFSKRTAAPVVAERSQAASSAPAIIDVTDADFADVVVAANRLALVDVWAEWCQPCTIMSAYMGFLARDYGERVLLTALDADENPETTAAYNILGLPTLLFLRDGREVERIVGVTEYAMIQQAVERYLPAN